MLAVSYLALYGLVWVFALQETILLVIVPIVLVGSAASHFMRSEYIITEEGIYWRNFMNMMFRDWLEIEVFIFEEEMGELFFDSKSLRNRVQRSIPVYYDENRPQVEALVREHHGMKWEKLRDEVRSYSRSQDEP